MFQYRPRGLPEMGGNVMDNKDSVRQLLLGSRTIDWMRKEINDTVSMVLGMVSKEEIEI